jgi:hypothetical protein
MNFILGVFMVFELNYILKMFAKNSVSDEKLSRLTLLTTFQVLLKEWILSNTAHSHYNIEIHSNTLLTNKLKVLCISK